MKKTLAVTLFSLAVMSLSNVAFAKGSTGGVKNLPPEIGCPFIGSNQC